MQPELKQKNKITMTITLVKEIHPETGRVRYSVERDGVFVNGTVTDNEDTARRYYNAVKMSAGATIWEREIMEEHIQ